MLNRRRSRRAGLWAVVAVVAVTAWAGVGCNGGEGAEAQQRSGGPGGGQGAGPGGRPGGGGGVPVVDAAPVTRGSIARSVTVSGVVAPIRTVGVNSQLPGAIQSIHAEEGDRVAAGEPLARMDDREIRAQLTAAVAAFEVADAALSAPVLLGVILLAGIVVNNAILLVEYAEQGRARGLSREDAVVEAGTVRLRPILMTTLTTGSGMLPLALGIGQGSELMQPLAIAVVGGLSVSTLLTLFVVPSAYVILNGAAERLMAWMTGGGGSELAPEPVYPEPGYAAAAEPGGR